MEELTRDVFEGNFPPIDFGRTLEQVENTITEVVEHVFRDEDDILLSCVNGRTMKPYTVDDVKNRPNGLDTFAENSSIPRWVKPVWANYEDTGIASGTYLEALCVKAMVTNDDKVRELARRTVKAIFTLCDNAANTKQSYGGGGKGWLPKPYAGIRNVSEMHETSADQYCMITHGLHTYYLSLATEQEKRKIEDIIISFADWWYDHDYAGVYFGKAIWWKRLEGHSMAAAYFLYLNALANSFKPCEKFQHGFNIWLNLKDMLFPPEPVWICMNGVALHCIQRLIELKPELGDYWQKVADHQTKLLLDSVNEKKGMNKIYAIDGFASHFISIAHEMMPGKGYDKVVSKCLEACTKREHFYHVTRGVSVSALSKNESGDDFIDAYISDILVYWLAGYWKLRLSETTMKNN